MYNFTLKHRNSDESNLLDSLRWVKGFKLDTLTGEAVPAADHYISEFMPVEYDEDYAYHSDASYDLISAGSIGVRYDSSRNKVSANLLVLATVRTVNIDDESIKYVRFSIDTGGADFDPDNTRFMEYDGITTPSIGDFPTYYTDREVKPSYSGLTRKYTKTPPNWYYSDDLVGKLKLIKDDFDYVNALPFDTKFILLVQDIDGAFTDHLSYFYKTDCEWDEDSKRVELSITTLDDYAELEGALNKTFNLIDLAPAQDSIEITKRPLIQIYIAGDSVITNAMGGNYWEQDLEIDPVTDDTDLVNDYHFFNAQNIDFIPDSYASGLSTDVTGDYDSAGLRDDGLYQVLSETGFSGSNPQIRYYIERVSDNVRLYETAWLFKFKDPTLYSNIFNGVGSETGTFYFTAYRIYVRFLSDLFSYGGSDLYSVPANDIVSNNSNYPRVVGFDTGEIFLTSEDGVSEPTEFGKFPDDSPSAGLYYKRLELSVILGIGNPIPVSYSNWKSVSLWAATDISDVRATEFNGGSVITIKDAFELHEVIQTLLDASGLNLTFRNTEEYSSFLYSTTNPITAGVSYLDFDSSGYLTTSAGNLGINLVPKTNIITSLYSSAAKKAELSLNDVFTALDSIYNIKHHIEGGKLRLEHVRWYQNGGTYSTPIVGVDGTQAINLKNGKPWSFATNKWKYDKNEMPERYEFSWMDDVSPAFEGYPIEIVSKLTEEGKIEDRSVSAITTDLDFVMASPSEISKSGFVMVNTVTYDGNKRVPFVERDLGSNRKVIMQNGFLSWLYLHPNFHTYNLPAYKAIINNNLVSLFNNKIRTKLQEFKIPVSASINPYELMTTNLGTGEIGEMQIDMQSLVASSTIKHDLEE